MASNKFTISISGSPQEAKEKVNGLAVLAAHLSAETITALAHTVKHDPDKVAIAKNFLGIK